MVMEVGLVLVLGDQKVWVFLLHLYVWVCAHVRTARTSLFLFGRSVSKVYFARAGQAPVSTLLTKKQLAGFFGLFFFFSVIVVLCVWVVFFLVFCFGGGALLFQISAWLCLFL